MKTGKLEPLDVVNLQGGSLTYQITGAPHTHSGYLTSISTSGGVTGDGSGGSPVSLSAFNSANSGYMPTISGSTLNWIPSGTFATSGHNHDDSYISSVTGASGITGGATSGYATLSLSTSTLGSANNIYASTTGGTYGWIPTSGFATSGHNHDDSYIASVTGASGITGGATSGAATLSLYTDPISSNVDSVYTKNSTGGYGWCAPGNLGISGGGGTVTSITAASGISTSDSNPITGSGTISLATNNVSGTLTGVYAKDGTNYGWVAPSALGSGGTVTSIAASAGPIIVNGASSGAWTSGAISTSGQLGLAYDADYLAISSGNLLTFSASAIAKLNTGAKMDIWTDLNPIDTTKYICDFSISGSTISKNEWASNTGDDSVPLFTIYDGRYYDNAENATTNKALAVKIKFEGTNLTPGGFFNQNTNGIFGYEFSDLIIIHIYLITLSGNLKLNFNVAKANKYTQIVLHLPNINSINAFNVASLSVTTYNFSSTYKTYTSIASNSTVAAEPFGGIPLTTMRTISSFGVLSREICPSMLNASSTGRTFSMGVTSSTKKICSFRLLSDVTTTDNVTNFFYIAKIPTHINNGDIEYSWYPFRSAYDDTTKGLADTSNIDDVTYLFDINPNV